MGEGGRSLGGATRDQCFGSGIFGALVATNASRVSWPPTRHTTKTLGQHRLWLISNELDTVVPGVVEELFLGGSQVLLSPYL